MIVRKIEGRIDRFRRSVYKRTWLLRNGRAARSTAVFVFGAQRSGTTLMAECLEESSEFDVYGETSAAFEKSVLKDLGFVRSLIEKSPRPFVAFKPLTDSHRVNTIMSVDPGSKAVWMYRRPEDRASSAVRKFGDTNLRFLNELVDVGPTDRWEARGMSEETLETIRRLDPKSMDPHSAAAAFWYLRNQLYFEQQLSDNENVLLLNYENLVASADETMRFVCRFLGCEYQPRMIAKIHAGSVGHSDVRISARVSEKCDEMLERLDRVRDEQWRRLESNSSRRSGPEQMSR